MLLIKKAWPISPVFSREVCKFQAIFTNECVPIVLFPFKKLVLIFKFEHDLSVWQHGCVNLTSCGKTVTHKTLLIPLDLERYSNKATIYICTSCDKAVAHKTLRISFSLRGYSKKTKTVATRY